LVLGIALESCAYPSGTEILEPPSAVKTVEIGTPQKTPKKAPKETPQKTPKDTQPASTPAVIQAENPFTKEKVKPIKWGTRAAPTTLPEELALQTILSAFEEKGITFEKNYSYNKDGVTTKLELYNPKKKIGFDIVYTIANDGSTNDPDSLDQKEEAVLSEDIKSAKRSIAVISTNDERFAGGLQSKENLAKAVKEFIAYLQATGAL
jgi:hypothetical protein